MTGQAVFYLAPLLCAYFGSGQLGANKQPTYDSRFIKLKPS